MNQEQETKLNREIRQQMLKVRNDAIVTGMKSALSVVLDMCKKGKSDKEKIKEIKEFCERGIHNGSKKNE